MQPVISRFCAAYRSRSSVVLYNSMVYMSHVTSELKQNTILHCSTLNLLADFRVSIIRSPWQAMLNERTTSCADRCIQRNIELTAPATYALC